MKKGSKHKLKSINKLKKSLKKIKPKKFLDVPYSIRVDKKMYIKLRKLGSKKIREILREL